MVGFTATCAALPPADAMALLDRLWQRFDTLASASGVFKVESASLLTRSAQLLLLQQHTLLRSGQR